MFDHKRTRRFTKESENPSTNYMERSRPRLRWKNLCKQNLCVLRGYSDPSLRFGMKRQLQRSRRRSQPDLFNGGVFGQGHNVQHGLSNGFSGEHLLPRGFRPELLPDGSIGSAGQ